MLKRTIFVLLFVMSLGASSVYAQKFTKKAQARREAREANYFYGASFTFTSGYVHSWMTNHSIDTDSKTFGKSERWGNTNNHFDIGFIWDQAINRHWGIQTGAYFTNKGGDHLFYYDNGLGYGPILLDEKTDEINVQNIELQSQGRFFIPLAKKLRVSLNAGFYVDHTLKPADGIGKWNLGPQVGLGIDWRHFSTSVTYQPGVFDDMYTKNSHSLQNALTVNVGVRVWKK